MKLRKNYIIHSELALPYLETPEDLTKVIFKTLETKFGLKKDSKQKLIDLGSGDGCIVVYSSINYGIRSFGCEINPNLIKETKEKIKMLKKEKIYQNKNFRKIIIKIGDIFILNLKKFDFIYIYSLPTMQKFLNHVFKTAKSGAVFISYKYPLKNFESYLKLDYILKDNDKNHDISYFYRKL